MRNFGYKSLRWFSPVLNILFKNRLRVLAYHDIIDSANFEAQIIWLKSKYNIIDISTLQSHLFHNQPLPKNSLLITLDDGDKTVYTKGLHIFKKHQVPSCLFIITDLINSRKDFWWNTIIKNEEKNGLSKEKIMEVINICKALPNDQRLNYLQKYKATFRDQLTLEEVQELKENSVFIANHSHTHPMFDKVNEAELKDELMQVKTFFEEKGIGDFTVFAYPNGNSNERSEQLLIENRIRMAFLFDHKLNEKHINPLRISRIAVDSDNPLSEFKTKVSGLHPMIFKVKKKLQQ